MGFFAEFSAWLNTLLAGYIGDNTARIAGALEPAIVTLGVVYVMVWGYLELTGQIEEPFIGGVKRIITLAVILGCALQLWLYNSLIVDTFFNAPAQLAAVVVGAFDPVGIVDQIIFDGGDAANLLIQKGGILDGNFAYYLAGFGVYLIVGLTAIYTIFLLALSRIALSVLLALGPALYRAAPVCLDQALLRGVACAAGELRVHHDPHRPGRSAHVACRHGFGAAGGQYGWGYSDRERGARVHGGGPHVPRDAPGHADGGRTCKRACPEQLWCRQRGARVGLWRCRAQHRAVCAGPGRWPDEPLGSLEPPGRLSAATRGPACRSDGI